MLYFEGYDDDLHSIPSEEFELASILSHDTSFELADNQTQVHFSGNTL